MFKYLLERLAGYAIAIGAIVGIAAFFAWVPPDRPGLVGAALLVTFVVATVGLLKLMRWRSRRGDDRH